MKITNSKYFYYSIIVVSIGIILFSIYYQLGGLKEFRVLPGQDVNYSIAGVEFKGNHNDRKIEEIYNKAKNLVADGRIKGTLSLIDYQSGMDDAEVQFFIGIILEERVSELPPEFEVRVIKANSVLRLVIDVHPLVRPTKPEIEAIIYAHAQSNGLVIEDYFLEKHLTDDRVIVEGFVK